MVTPALAALNRTSDHVDDLVVAPDGTVYATEYGTSPSVGYGPVRVSPGGAVAELVPRTVTASCTGALEIWAMASHEHVALDGAGDLLFTATACGGSIGGTPRRVVLRRTSGGALDVLVDGPAFPTSATFAIEPTGAIVYTSSDGRLRRRATTGVVTTIAGMGGSTTMSTGDFGPASAARLQAPQGVAILPGGRIAVGEDYGLVAGLRVIW